MLDNFIKKLVKENIETQKNPPDYSYLEDMTIREIKAIAKNVVRDCQKKKMNRLR